MAMGARSPRCAPVGIPRPRTADRSAWRHLVTLSSSARVVELAHGDPRPVPPRRGAVHTDELAAFLGPGDQVAGAAEVDGDRRTLLQQGALLALRGGPALDGLHPAAAPPPLRPAAQSSTGGRSARFDQWWRIASRVWGSSASLTYQ